VRRWLLTQADELTLGLLQDIGLLIAVCVLIGLLLRFAK
jgi:hypothetical protein